MLFVRTGVSVSLRGARPVPLAAQWYTLGRGPSSRIATQLGKCGVVDSGVEGKSIWPRLRAGDEAQLTDRTSRPVREGDVVVARVSDKVIIHRVVALERDELRPRAEATDIQTLFF